MRAFLIVVVVFLFVVLVAKVYAEPVPDGTVIGPVHSCFCSVGGGPRGEQGTGPGEGPEDIKVEVKDPNGDSYRPLWWGPLD